MTRRVGIVENNPRVVYGVAANRLPILYVFNVYVYACEKVVELWVEVGQNKNTILHYLLF